MLMRIKAAWAFQSLFICFFFNIVFAAVVFFMADGITKGLNDWISPLVGSGAAALPEELRLTLQSFGTLIQQARLYLIPALAALFAAVTLLLWFFIYLAGGRQIRRAGERAMIKASTPELNQPRVKAESPELSNLPPTGSQS